MKSIRIFIKYLRKFLAGFVSITPFVKINSKEYPFNRENRTISNDLASVGEDFGIAINKTNKNNDRKQ
ncbi:MAG: hypothetical protein ACJAZX_000814 [Rickettsiales bacterium]|jgi:hypothetical protein